jgi:recombination protein RecA
MYNEGISREGEIIALGEKYGIIKKAGQSYEYPQEKGEAVKLGRGYDATRQFLKENSKVENEILKVIRAKLKESI